MKVIALLLVSVALCSAQPTNSVPPDAADLGKLRVIIAQQRDFIEAQRIVIANQQAQIESLFEQLSAAKLAAKKAPVKVRIVGGPAITPSQAVGGFAR